MKQEQTTVTTENYEEYLLLQADGELSAEEASALEAFLEAHPEFRSEQEAYLSLRLVPDEAVVFEDRATLYKTAPPHRIPLTPWSYGLAAGILLMLGVWTLNRPASVDGPVLADRQSQPAAPAPARRTIPTSAAPSANAPAPPSIASAVRVQPSRKPLPTSVPMGKPAVAEQSAEPLVPVGDVALQMAPEAQTARIEPSVIMPETPLMARVATKSVGQLGIEEGRLEAFNSLSEAAASRLRKVKKLRDDLRGTDATVQIAGRDLFTLHF
jgi:hypothetical protein